MTKQNRSHGKKALIILLLVIIAAAAAVTAVLRFSQDSTPGGKADSGENQANSGSTSVPSVNGGADVSIDLGQGLTITGILNYSGPFYEDGENSPASGILAVTVTNTSEKYLEYLEFSIPFGGQIAEFSLSTLPSGESAVILEKNRMAFTDASSGTPAVKAAAFFDSVPGLRPDSFELTVTDGIINVKNVSGSDITDDILVYYKNFNGETYYGGITYRVRISGGLADGELRQVTASHFTADGSALMFIDGGN